MGMQGGKKREIKYVSVSVLVYSRAFLNAFWRQLEGEEGYSSSTSDAMCCVKFSG